MNFFRSTAFKLLFLGIFLAIAVPSCNTWWWFYRQSLFIDLLPPKLEIEGSVMTAEGNFIRSSCFLGIYKLSDKTISNINQEGLAFFKDATKSRAYVRKRDDYDYYHSYQQWQKTPIQAQTGNRTFDVGLVCARDNGFDKSLLEKISIVSSSQGSFYTGHSEGQLVVIPSLGVAVLSGIGD